MPRSISSTMEVTLSRPLLGGPKGIAVSPSWLRRGLASFLWASSRSMASLHQRAASSLKKVCPPNDVTDGTRLQLTGSFVQYLFERHGMNRLRRFFHGVDKVGIESAARGAFGRGFFELELEWESMLSAMDI